MSKVVVFCFFASYCFALACEVARALLRVPALRWGTVAATAAGFFAHTVFLVNRSQAVQLPPLLSSSRDWLLVVAWIACLFYLLAVLSDARVGLSLFALPTILLLVAGSTVLSDQPSPAATLAGRDVYLRRQVMLHASLLGLGVVAVVAGLLSSAMYLFQHRRLRRKLATPGNVSIFSLETLAGWNRLSIWAAVPLIGAGLGVGYLMGLTARPDEFRISFWDPLVVTTTVGWLVLLLALGRVFGSRDQAPRSVAIRTSVGFGLLLFTLWSVQLLTGKSGHAVRAAAESAPAAVDSGTRR